MYCKYCNTQISDTSKFCPQCGQKAEFEDIPGNYVDCYCDICGAKYQKEDTV